MTYFHLILGITIFIIFTITGRYMRIDFPDKEIIPQELRLLMRSRHIYILFSSFLHIILGLYFQTQLNIWRKSFQLFGSFLLTLGSILFVWAFVYETYTIRHFSDISRLGLYATLGGIIFHFFGKVWTKSA